MRQNQTTIRTNSSSLPAAEHAATLCRPTQTTAPCSFRRTSRLPACRADRAVPLVLHRRYRNPRVLYFSAWASPRSRSRVVARRDRPGSDRRNDSPRLIPRQLAGSAGVSHRVTLLAAGILVVDFLFT